MPITQLTSHHPAIRAELDGFVATVTLDRPASKNSCTGDMWVAIGAAFREIAHSGARAVVLTGANGEFCAGADIAGGDAPRELPGPTREHASMVDSMRVLADVVVAVHECPMPVVAKVDGNCIGAGLGLALAADLLWCSDRARFSAIFAKRGLSMDFGTSWLLRQRIGVHKAKELAFTAKLVSAQEADALGLVNAVVPVADLDAAVDELIATIAGGPPIALGMTKRQLDGAGGSSLHQALEAEALAQSVNVRTSDLKEALTAFMEKRPAVFEGR